MAFPFDGGETTAWKKKIIFRAETFKIKENRNDWLSWLQQKFSTCWLTEVFCSFNQNQKFETEYEANESTYWLFELLWRDYFKYISPEHGNEILNKMASNEPSEKNKNVINGKNGHAKSDFKIYDRTEKPTEEDKTWLRISVNFTKRLANWSRRTLKKC